jgi:hypothetical protein
MYVLLLLVGLVLVLPIWQQGLITGGDWIFPYTNLQLQEFYNSAHKSWTYREIPTGTQVLHHNLYLLEIFAGLFVFAGVSGIIFQKIFLSLIIVSICVSSYFLFYKVSKSSIASALGCITYLFSPIFFNYLSMGWIWVLLFMAILPLLLLLIHNYFIKHDYGALIVLGLVTSVLFAQSQVVFWVPLTLLAYAVSYYLYIGNNNENIFVRFVVAVSIVMSIVFLIHMSWIIPMLIGSDSSALVSGGISKYDFGRFNEVNVSYLLRGWGSVYNEQYELSYNTILSIFSFYPVFILIGLLVSVRKKSQFTYLAVLLVLIPFLVFSFRYIIQDLPFANIIRDFNRFIVLSNLGFALAVTLFFAHFSKKKFRMLGLVIILISAYPFFNGSLFKWMPELVKDTKVRFLTVPQNEIETVMEKYAGSKNLLFPTGGHVGTCRDKRFTAPFAETPDFDAQFSPFASGIYASDKSAPLVANFSTNYIRAAIFYGEEVVLLSRIYGVENIFIRNNLFSSIDRDFNSHQLNLKGCSNTLYNKSAWSISKVCKVSVPYPLVYIPDIIINSEHNELLDLLSNINIGVNDKVGVIGCPDGISFKDEMACSLNSAFKTKGAIPSVKFNSDSSMRIKVTVSGIKDDYILVLNQTFHSGWVLKNAVTGKIQNYQKKLVNHLVNGWLITVGNDVKQQSFIIEYAPQENYIRLRNISIIIFIGLIILAMILYMRNKNHVLAKMPRELS